MKIIKNGICYIEREDIEFIGALPQKVYDKIKWNTYYSIKFNFIKLKDEDSVTFFQNKEYILDYDSIKDLSIEELEQKKKEIEKRLKNQSLIWLNSSERGRRKLDKDDKYNTCIRLLNYYLESLNKYINNKELYDSEISTLSFNNFKKVELKRYPAVSRTEPVARIPVSSSELEKLDRGIRSKCKQNASEQAIGRAFAENYFVRGKNFSVEYTEKEQALVLKNDCDKLGQ